MASVTHFDLWTDVNPVVRIKNLIEELDYTKTTLQESTCENIVERLCNEGYTIASEVVATMPSSNSERSVVQKPEINGTSGELALVGKGAVYDEFGTGEEGADNPHPMKSQFPLNPYNSGYWVSRNINPFTGRHYWIYEPMSGKPYFDLYGIPGYTEGVPASMPMYDALLHIRKVKGDIIVDEINNALNTLK